jgi:hypothetical protein
VPEVQLRAAAVVPVAPAARPAWARWSPAGPAWALWVLALLGLLATAWLDRLLRLAGRPELASLPAAIPLMVAMVTATTVGAVLAGRRPGHPVGWLLLAVSLCLNASGVVQAYADYGLLARPGSLPAARYAGLYLPATVVTALTCLGFVPRPFDRPYQGAENPLDVSGLTGPLLVIYQLAFAVTNLAVLVGAVSLVVRFRRARGTERQQLRWVALAAALALLGSVVVLALSVRGASPALLGWVAGVYFAILPLAIGAAILRYRLYDLDRIVSRTLAYALLTILLALGYAAVVLGLGRLLPQGSSLVVAAATLGVAAVFQPARRRIQAAVDRRFNRRRHDAARVIEAFGARLRDQVDLDSLSAELLAVVDQTMQPTQAWLWQRPPPGAGRARSLSR